MKSYLVILYVSSLMVLFQNCADHNFSATDELFKASESNESTIDDLVSVDPDDDNELGGSTGGSGSSAGGGAGSPRPNQGSTSGNSSQGSNAGGGSGSGGSSRQNPVDGLEVCKGPTDVNCIKPNSPSQENLTVCNGPDCQRYICVDTDCYNQTTSFLKVKTPGSNTDKEVCMSKNACENILSQFKKEVKAVESTAKCGTTASATVVHRTDAQVQQYVHQLKGE
jgi:hypothetical protein